MFNSKRLNIVLSIALSLFFIIILNLYNLQINKQADVESEILRQNFQTFYIPAARGDILDVNGNELATSKFKSYLYINTSKISDENRNYYQQYIEYNYENLSTNEIAKILQSNSPLVAVGEILDKSKTLTDINSYQAFLIYEIPYRVYENNKLFAHVVGYTGVPTLEEEVNFINSKRNNTVGKNGLERAYDNVLSGTPGKITIKNGEIVDYTPPIKGQTLETSLDLNLQTVVRNSLVEGIDLANKNFDTESLIQRGAVVVQKIDTGEIISMVSLPDFNPNQFIEGISNYDFIKLNREKAFNNYAIQGLYPPGSVFKVVAHWLALNENLYPEGANFYDDKIDCEGSLSFGFNDGSQQVYKDWKIDGHGSVDLGTSIQKSCNVYFWDIALKIWRTYGESESESILQDYAKSIGFGTQTLIDLPFEKFGVIPDRDLFEEWKTTRPELVRAEGWLGGDLMNLIIGQGAITATPIQVSNAYRSLVIGQKDKPYLASEYFEPNAKEIDITSGDRKLLLDDLGKVTDRDGTAFKSFSIMGDISKDVGGKTGTAQNPGDLNDTSWFVGIDSLSDPKFVIVVVVEEGGSGSAVSAPITRRIIQYLRGLDMTPVEFGEVTE